jgi:hypothetical protein
MKSAPLTPRVPFAPEPLARLRGRYSAALNPLVDHRDVGRGDWGPPPSGDAPHVFDTEDGMRLIVSRERFLDGREGVHISVSFYTTPPVPFRTVEDVFARIAETLARDQRIEPDAGVARDHEGEYSALFCGKTAVGRMSRIGETRAQKEKRRRWDIEHRPQIRRRRKAWRRLNRAKIQAQQRAQLLRKYGLNSEDYEQLLARQEGRCAICLTRPQLLKGRHGVVRRRLCIDHDHETGRVRGALCPRCNLVIGCVMDQVSVLLAAIAYLEHVERPQ